MTETCPDCGEPAHPHRIGPIPRMLTDAEIDQLIEQNQGWFIGDDNCWHNAKTGESMDRHWSDD